MKNCDLGLENAALGLWPRAAFSRPWSQVLTVRTSQLANNIYIFLMDAISCGSINSKPAHLPYFTSTYKFLPIPCPTLKSCQMPNICLEWGRGGKGGSFQQIWNFDGTVIVSNRSCSIYQYSSMGPRLLGQNCKYFMFLVYLNFQKRLGYKENNTKYSGLT